MERTGEPPVGERPLGMEVEGPPAPLGRIFVGRLDLDEERHGERGALDSADVYQMGDGRPGEVQVADSSGKAANSSRRAWSGVSIRPAATSALPS